jgi:hypothetical protein
MALRELVGTVKGEVRDITEEAGGSISSSGTGSTSAVPLADDSAASFGLGCRIGCDRPMSG